MFGPTEIEKSDPQLYSAQREGLVRDLPLPENKRFYPALDGLRALAVLMVFFEHYESAEFPAFNWGWVGVDVFFVLSGFLITGILYDTRETKHRFRNFYVRRILRIFPLYYGVLLLGVLLTPIFHWLWNPAWILWFCYLGYYSRFIYLHDPLFVRGAIEHLVAKSPLDHIGALYLGHFWSLCVEEQFYLVWPFIVFRIRDRVRLRNFCALICGLTLLLRVMCVVFVPNQYLSAELLYRITPLRVDALLLGGVVALCLRGPEGGTGPKDRETDSHHLHRWLCLLGAHIPSNLWRAPLLPSIRRRTDSHDDRLFANRHIFRSLDTFNAAT